MSPVPLSIDPLRPCLEGTIPAVIATCASDGTPNVAFLSQVEYVDSQHLALSFQFFNKTRRNVLANPHVEMLVIHPRTGGLWRLQAHYLRTETEGPLFERMKAKLAGIASQSGMADVFRLLGSDVYRVEAIEEVTRAEHELPPEPCNRLAALRRASERLAACGDLASLFETTFDVLAEGFGVTHAMLLLPDDAGQKLYTVASRGYEASGVGSEIPLGVGVIGVAAQARTAIRINHMTLAYGYSRAIRERMRALGQAGSLEAEIDFPGLPEPHSQLALPLDCCAGSTGVLFVESMEDLRFGWDDEDALAAIAHQVGMMMRALQGTADAPSSACEACEPASAEPAKPIAQGKPLRVRHFEADGSVFLDNDYLIKGVAGRIVWHLLNAHEREGRREFSNRELRLAGSIGLPELGDNLEARLHLLTRRLDERAAPVRLARTGRGRFRIDIARPLVLVSVPR
jgi:hypothetical protein